MTGLNLNLTKKMMKNLTMMIEDHDFDHRDDDIDNDNDHDDNDVDHNED